MKATDLDLAVVYRDRIRYLTEWLDAFEEDGGENTYCTVDLYIKCLQGGRGHTEVISIPTEVAVGYLKKERVEKIEDLMSLGVTV